MFVPHPRLTPPRLRRRGRRCVPPLPEPRPGPTGRAPQTEEVQAEPTDGLPVLLLLLRPGPEPPEGAPQLGDEPEPPEGAPQLVKEPEPLEGAPQLGEEAEAEPEPPDRLFFSPLLFLLVALLLLLLQLPLLLLQLPLLLLQLPLLLLQLPLLLLQLLLLLL